MTAITTNDEAIAVARRVEEYLFILDRGNALKNGTTETRRSPITELAGALSNWLARLSEITSPDETAADLMRVIEERMPKGYHTKTYFRPGNVNQAPYYEAIVTRESVPGYETYDVTFPAQSEVEALRGVLRQIEVGD